MNIEEFCRFANEHDLIKGKYVSITPELLSSFGFSKKSYTKASIIELSVILKGRNELKNSEILDQLLSAKETEAKNYLLKTLAPYILSYYNNDKRSGVSLVSIYALIPSVQKWINEIRTGYRINPKVLREKVLFVFPDQERHIVLSVSKDESPLSQRQYAYRALLDMGNYSENEKTKRIKEYNENLKRIIEKKDLATKMLGEYFPDEDSFSNFEIDVNAFCRGVLQLPKEYYGYFKNFILFEEIDDLDDFNKYNSIKSHSVDTEFIFEPQYKRYYADLEKIENFEPYISVKLFGDTTREEARKMIDALYDGEFVKKLPSYHFVNSTLKSKSKSLLKQSVLMLLMEGRGLSAREACNVLKSINGGLWVKVTEADENNASRDIKRLKKTLSLPSRWG